GRRPGPGAWWRASGGRGALVETRDRRVRRDPRGRGLGFAPRERTPGGGGRARARDPARPRARLALQPALAGCSYRRGPRPPPLDRPRDQAEGRGAVSGAGTREAGPGIVPAP